MFNQSRPRCCAVIEPSQPGVMAAMCFENAARILTCSEVDAEDGEYKYALYCDKHMPPLADMTWYRFTRSEVIAARRDATAKA
jgi:hypothetical protein